MTKAEQLRLANAEAAVCGIAALIEQSLSANDLAALTKMMEDFCESSTSIGAEFDQRHSGKLFYDIGDL